MRKRLNMATGILGILVAAGCRTATKVTEVPRVDLDLAGGNRGYLIGTPPETAALKTTRTMVQTDVEIPTFYKPTQGAAPTSSEALAQPEPEPAMTEAPAGGEQKAAARYDTYVVQKGDSLSTIAAKPEIYGHGSRWRRIFDANRDQLKSPDRVQAGMTLKIPRGDHEEPRHTHHSKKGARHKNTK